MVERLYEAVVGEQFLTGETWTSPRGTKYHVKEVRFPRPQECGGYNRMAILITDKGRKVIRAWDAVEGWVRYPEDNR